MSQQHLIRNKKPLSEKETMEWKINIGKYLKLIRVQSINTTKQSHIAIFAQTPFVTVISESRQAYLPVAAPLQSKPYLLD